jgi:hypothetical protein
MASGEKQWPGWEKLLESARRTARKLKQKTRSSEKASHPWLSFSLNTSKGFTHSPSQSNSPASDIVPSAPRFRKRPFLWFRANREIVASRQGK